MGQNAPTGRNWMRGGATAQAHNHQLSAQNTSHGVYGVFWIVCVCVFGFTLKTQCKIPSLDVNPTSEGKKVTRSLARLAAAFTCASECVAGIATMPPPPLQQVVAMLARSHASTPTVAPTTLILRQPRPRKWEEGSEGSKEGRLREKLGKGILESKDFEA